MRHSTLSTVMAETGVALIGLTNLCTAQSDAARLVACADGSPSDANRTFTKQAGFWPALYLSWLASPNSGLARIRRPRSCPGPTGSPRLAPRSRHFRPFPDSTLRR